MQPQKLISPAVPENCEIFVGIITSDFQTQIRGGAWMGFDNASWDDSVLPSLIYPNKRVDVHHMRGDSICAYMVALEAATTPDYKRVLGNWASARPMDYVIATFALPHNSQALKVAERWLMTRKKIGISIEHGGRKPRWTIGPYVTICDGAGPWNTDAWMIYSGDGTYIYSRKFLPLSIKEVAAEQLKAVLALPREVAPTKFSPATYEGKS
jgi:hypothetical protein